MKIFNKIIYSKTLIREMQIKILMRFQLISVKIAIIKTWINNILVLLECYFMSIIQNNYLIRMPNSNEKPIITKLYCVQRGNCHLCVFRKLTSFATAYQEQNLFLTQLCINLLYTFNVLWDKKSKEEKTDIRSILKMVSF